MFVFHSGVGGCYWNRLHSPYLANKWSVVDQNLANGFAENWHCYLASKNLSYSGSGIGRSSLATFRLNDIPIVARNLGKMVPYMIKLPSDNGNEL